MEDNKIYVFLSHSHRDYEKVRIIRDLLEKEGFRPLMFFLKCLEKKEYKELTEILIKEEIDSRQRFILCESENAVKSDWVKFEIKHIKETNRPYEIVNLDWSNEKIEGAIRNFKKRSTVFLAYPNNLYKLAVAANNELKKLDFRTFIDIEQITYGDKYDARIIKSLNEASSDGYVLVFLDENLKESSYLYHEISIALRLSYINSHIGEPTRNRIIPIWASNNLDLSSLFRSRPDIKLLLGGYHGIDICKKTTKEACEEIGNKLLEIDIKYFQ